MITWLRHWLCRRDHLEIEATSEPMANFEAQASQDLSEPTAPARTDARSEPLASFEVDCSDMDMVKKT